MKFLWYIFAAVLIAVWMFWATCGGIFMLLDKDTFIWWAIAVIVFLSIVTLWYKIVKKISKNNSKVNPYIFSGIFWWIWLVVAIWIYLTVINMSFWW